MFGSSATKHMLNFVKAMTTLCQSLTTGIHGSVPLLCDKQRRLHRRRAAARVSAGTRGTAQVHEWPCPKATFTTFLRI
jgi:hypothetical protein